MSGQWFWWVLIALWTFEIGVKVACIGDTRKPITKGDAVTTLIVNWLLIWGVVAYGVR